MYINYHNLKKRVHRFVEGIQANHDVNFYRKGDISLCCFQGPPPGQMLHFQNDITRPHE